MLHAMHVCTIGPTIVVRVEVQYYHRVDVVGRDAKTIGLENRESA